MTLFEPIIWRDRVMLPGGKALTPDDINILRRRFPDLHIRVGDPVLDETVEFEDEGHNKRIAQAVRERITETFSHVDSKFARHTSLARIDFRAIRTAVDEIGKLLASDPPSAALISRAWDSGSFLSHHTGNVFYLSMVLGTNTKAYVSQERLRQSKARELHASVTTDLVPLGLGVLFMDVGLLGCKELLKKGGELTRDEVKTLRNHPAAAADLLPANFSSAARVIVRTHHENTLGSGYPNKLPGGKLHVLSRIVRIADAYDAATAKDVFPQARSPVRALWEMYAGPMRHYYDPELMKAFIKIVQPFPISTKLELEDGRFAVVVQNNRQNPFAPIASIAYGPDGKPLPEDQLAPPQPIHPSENLRIKSFDDEDMSFLYGGPTGKPDPVPPDKPQTVFDLFYP